MKKLLILSLMLLSGCFCTSESEAYNALRHAGYVDPISIGDHVPFMCIVHDKKWREAPSDTECNQWLRNWAGLDPSPAAQTIRDQARQIQVREGHIAVLTQLMQRDDELQDLQRHGVLTPEQAQAALDEHRRAWEQALLGYDHDSHGRGTAESGPDDPDCPCRDTIRQAVCATAGCGFCLAAQTRKTP